MLIFVLDAQGAGLGRTVIAKLINQIKPPLKIVALATNNTAAENMMAAGADDCIVGDEAIIRAMDEQTDALLVGPIGILCAGGIGGEITAALAEAVYRFEGRKYLIPLEKHGFIIPMASGLKIKDSIDWICSDIRKIT